MPRKVSVLVVDDFPDGRDMLSEYLAFKGFSVSEASAGAEAVEIARRITPDVILMDLQMPGIDGWEATRQLKADPKTKGITVVVVTARALQHDVDTARKAGCDAVIVKPFEIAVLADSLLRVLTQGPSVFDVPGLNRPPSRRRRVKPAERASLATRRMDAKKRVPDPTSDATTSRTTRTTTPTNQPLPLRCPDCDDPLEYVQSFVSGTRTLQEQWDVFTCRQRCGDFEYRHRTRKVRRIESGRPGRSGRS